MFGELRVQACESLGDCIASNAGEVHRENGFACEEKQPA